MCDNDFAFPMRPIEAPGTLNIFIRGRSASQGPSVQTLCSPARLNAALAAVYSLVSEVRKLSETIDQLVCFAFNGGTPAIKASPHMSLQNEFLRSV